MGRGSGPDPSAWEGRAGTEGLGGSSLRQGGLVPLAASLLSSICWLTASGMPGTRLDWVYSAEFSLGIQGFSQRLWSLARWSYSPV